MSFNVQQFDKTDCGAACLASIARYYRLKLPVWKIRQLAGTNRIGTSAYGLIHAAEKLGFDAKGIEITSDELSEIPLPAIAHLKLSNGQHHFVVVFKVGKRTVKVMDPADGKMMYLSFADFNQKWTGVAILLIPSIDFKVGNEKVSLTRRLLSLVTPHRHVFVQSGFGALAFSIIGVSTAIYIQKITDFVLVGHNENLLHLMSIIMIVLVMFQVVLGMLQSWFVLRVGQNIDTTLITSYYEHLMKLPQRFFDSMRVGELISRVNDAIKIRNFINQVAVEAVVDVLIILIAFLVMFVVNWKLAILTSLVIPVYFLIFLVTNRVNRKVERKKMEKTAELEIQLVESLRASKTIKQMGAETYFTEQSEDRLMNVLEEVYKSGKIDILSGSSMLTINRLLTIVVLWIGAGIVIDNKLTPGELMSFFAITSFFIGPIARLLGMNKTVQGALIASDRLFEILDLISEDESVQGDVDELVLKGDVSFKSVDFSYTLEQDLFKDLSFSIKQGSITALLGDSGSGKSTIGYLLQGLYPISSGRIAIGNVDIGNVPLSFLRKVVGVVPQNIELFAGNVIENIALGDYSPNMKRLNDIIDRLNLHDIIEALPEGLYTWLGENAIQLSGGQRQRLAIARVMYLDPDIYVFDEATSFLDDRTEQQVKNIILKLRDKGKTVVMVAHRLSTIDIADELFVFSKGRVLEHGTYDGLVEKKGRFYEMVQHHTRS